MNVVRRSLIAEVVMLLALSWLPLHASAAAEYEKFFGTYRGTAVTHGGQEVEPRDISVKIKPSDRGFVVDWVALIHKSDGRTKRVDYSIHFRPTRRPHIYGSAMKVDVFGKAIPLDPLQGDPYVWARIDGKTLTVYAMLITERGGYEMQVYNRTLVPGGMKLTYSRVRNGKVLRTVTGTLQRVP